MSVSSSQARKTSENGKKRKKVLKLENKETKPFSISAGLDKEELVFALDIGTRSVVGVIRIQEDRKFKIITTEVIEHKNRSMLDGQIHDIDQVAIVVREIKDRIEKRLGFPLKKVAIAAAGRVLRTCQVRLD